MNEKRIEKPQAEKTEKKQPPSDEIAYRSEDMQDAIRKVKDITISRATTSKNAKSVNNDKHLKHGNRRAKMTRKD